MPTELMAETRKPQYSDDIVTELTQRMQVAFEQAKENLAMLAERQVKQRAKVAKTKNLKEGDLVYLYTLQVKKGKTGKLSQFNEVNFEIKPVTGRGKPQVVHVDDLKCYIPRQPYPEWQEQSLKETEDSEALLCSEPRTQSKHWPQENGSDSCNESENGLVTSSPSPQRGRPIRFPATTPALPSLSAPSTSMASRSPLSGYFLCSQSRKDYTKSQKSTESKTEPDQSVLSMEVGMSEDRSEENRVSDWAESVLSFMDSALS